MRFTAIITIGLLVAAGLWLATHPGDDVASTPSAADVPQSTPAVDSDMPAKFYSKRTIPVEVEVVEMRPDGAHLRLTFPAGSTDVSIHLNGMDGLNVTSDPQALEGASYPAGETVDVVVDFVAPREPSYLNAEIRGVFHGQAGAMIKTLLAPGDGSTPRRKPSTLSVDPATGEAINAGGPIQPNGR